MNQTLSKAAQVAIAFHVDEMRGIRAIVATYLSRFAYELARDGGTAPSVEQLCTRMAKRFRLCDYFGAVYLAYLSDLGKREAYNTRLARCPV